MKLNEEKFLSDARGKKNNLSFTCELMGSDFNITIEEQ